MSKWKDERALVLDVIAEAMNKQHWRCPTYGLLTLWVNIFFKLLYPLWVRGSIITANIIQIHIPPPTIHFPKINQSSLLKLHITSCYFAAYVSPMASHPFQNTTETPTCLQKLTWSDLFFPSWPTFFFSFFTFDRLAFFWILKHGRISPVLGPLHELFSLPGVFFPGL